jgi:two-component system sensor histidine kinase KdpD
MTSSKSSAPATFLRRPWLGYGLAVALTALATITALGVEQWMAIPNLSLIFVLPVVILAVSFGGRSAMTTAALSVVAYNFFLIEPRLTFRVADPANVWALVLLLAVAVMVSALAAQSRRRAEVATALADQASAVQSLARALVAAPDRAAILEAAAHTLNRVFGVPAAVLTAQGEEIVSSACPAGVVTPGDIEAARWAIASRDHTRAEGFPADGVAFDFWPAGAASAVPAAVGLDLGAGADKLPADWQRLLEIITGYLAVALEREHFADVALKTRVRTESERVKADLLAAVSHDLKTPLSSILVSLQSLRRFADSHDRQAHDDLLAVAEAETARLGGLVGNLLDMSRIDAEAVAVRPTRLSLRSLLDAARLRAGPALAGHEVVEHVAAGAPAALADVSLTAAALANVLENAAKYSALGSLIEVRAGRGDGRVVIEVLDQGPGFPDPSEPLFGKFARGVEGDGRPPGTGLGLAIARGFLEAQGGRIEAESRADGPGGLVRITLPAARAKRAAA